MGTRWAWKLEGSHGTTDVGGSGQRVPMSESFERPREWPLGILECPRNRQVAAGREVWVWDQKRGLHCLGGFWGQRTPEAGTS